MLAAVPVPSASGGPSARTGTWNLLASACGGKMRSRGRRARARLPEAAPTSAGKSAPASRASVCYNLTRDYDHTQRGFAGNLGIRDRDRLRPAIRRRLAVTEVLRKLGREWLRAGITPDILVTSRKAQLPVGVAANVPFKHYVPSGRHHQVARATGSWQRATARVPPDRSSEPTFSFPAYWTHSSHWQPSLAGAVHSRTYVDVRNEHLCDSTCALLF
jgi:hypothetical protein